MNERIFTVQDLLAAALAAPRHATLLLRGVDRQLVAVFEEEVYEPHDVEACAERFTADGVVALAARDGDVDRDALPLVQDLVELLRGFVSDGHGGKAVLLQDTLGDYHPARGHLVRLEDAAALDRFGLFSAYILDAA